MEILNINNRYDVISAIKFIRDNELTYKKVKPSGFGRIYQFTNHSGSINFIVSFKRRSPALCSLLEEKIGFKTEIEWLKRKHPTVINRNTRKPTYKVPKDILRRKLDEVINSSNDD